MTYFYWLILKISVDHSHNKKPCIDSFSPIRKQWQYLEHTGHWSVQLESEVTPNQAVRLFESLTAISRCWVNSALIINGEAVGGPWDVETFPEFVAGYSLTYARTNLIPLNRAL